MIGMSHKQTGISYVLHDLMFELQPFECLRLWLTMPKNYIYMIVKPLTFERNRSINRY